MRIKSKNINTDYDRETKIGEFIEYDGRLLECIHDESFDACKGCYFYKEGCILPTQGGYEMHRCFNRKDNKFVIFKEI